MKISVVIPTWNRVDFLEKAFKGLQQQVRPCDEVIVGVRDDDTATLEWLASQNTLSCEVKIALLQIPGFIQSLQAGVNQSTGDVVCLIDDDASPFPDWLQKIETYFLNDPKLGAVGGRDIFAYLTKEEVNKNLQNRVGVFTWYGKFLANHHCGSGKFRHVKVLKGCNCSFRGHLIRKAGFDQKLKGRNTQHHSEIALCLDVLNEGFKVGYDPDIKVTHYVAPRHGPDINFRDSGFSEEGVFHMAHNYIFALHSRLKFPFMIDLYTLAIGDKQTPGFLQWLRLSLRRDPTATRRFRASLKGYIAGLHTAKEKRKSMRQARLS